MYQSYKGLIERLRREVPPVYPVDVRRVKVKEGLDGYCQRRDEKFYIRINRNLGEPAAIDALLHEWAHARAWKFGHESLPPDKFVKAVHGSAWGVAYAEVYRVFQEYNNEIIAKSNSCSQTK